MGWFRKGYNYLLIGLGKMGVVPIFPFLKFREMKKYDNGSVRYVLFKSGYFFGEDNEQWCDRRKIMSVDEYCDRDGDYEEGACVDWLIKGYKERGLEMHYIEKQRFDRS